MLSVKLGDINYFLKKSFWYNLTWDWTLVSRTAMPIVKFIKKVFTA